MPDDKLAMKYIKLWKQRQYAPLMTGKTPLHAASIIGDVLLVKTLVEECICDVNAPYSSDGVDGITPLHLAAEMGHVRIVRLLITLNCDIDAQLSSGQTPLISACDKGHEDVVKVLLKAGASVEINGVNCMYAAFRQAVLTNCTDVLEELLINAGPTLNVNSVLKDEYFQSTVPPICWAAEAGFDRVIELLVQRNCELLQVTKIDEKTPLMHALANKHHSTAKMLIKMAPGVDIFAKDANGATALIYSIAAGYEDIVEELLNASVDPNESFWVEKDVRACALNICCQTAMLKIAIMLLDAGANPNATSDITTPPIISAINAQNSELVAQFLMRNAVITIGSNSPTPLQLAIANEDVAIAKLLLDSNQININEDTIVSESDDAQGTYLALHYAASRGSVDVVSLLVDSGGALVNQKNADGLTALCVACKFNRSSVVAKLLEYHADCNLYDNCGLNALHYACMQPTSCIVKLLAESGADLQSVVASSQDIVSPWSNATPLLIACKCGAINVIEYLLSKETLNLNEQQQSELLSSTYESGQFEILNVLKSHGFNMSSLKFQLKT